ncbi:ONAC010 protein [Hibiscus syriacus]|uniref:ONAC010 protein n=2 Tax=Hibiscus syriacus TaxID=106335 RepID=A0A6A2ZJ01_HIBSY|nr:ONAC010 protein [Hibiscus syriacus]
MEIPPPSLHHASPNGGLVVVEPLKKDQPNMNGNGNDVEDGYLDSFPPGFRFCPLDEELVLHYLRKKVMNLPLPQNRIMEVNLYSYNPEKLAEQHKQYGEKEWYFFTPRDKKYRNGTRPNRAAGDGYWKATGADRKVRFNNNIIGFRKALVFYRGKPPKGDKTYWIMHEYRVNDPPSPRKERAGYNDMRLDDWVLCRIYKKQDKSGKTQTKNDETSPPNQNPEDPPPNEEIIGSDDIIDYNAYFNMGGFVNQSLADESFNILQNNFIDQFPTWCLNDRLEQQDVWSGAGNLEHPAPLDMYVQPLVQLDLSTKNTNNSDENSSYKAWVSKYEV